MYWKDEGYLLSKHNFDENSIIIETFTLDHGKYTGIVYGGSSKKQKRNFQVGNKILLDWKSKNQNRSGYFNVELINPISPFFFDDKKRSACILSATSILKILLPERQINKKIYNSFENMLFDLKSDNWIKLYINWELSLIKELGFETNLKENYNDNTKKALIFNRNLLMENFIIPHGLKFPLFRNILENYFL
jgi:DNA repair protein RecO (recombination protein O)